jgi:mannose-1-phosphate guanylyltransferase
VKVAIMAGGQGTRFWPLSRESRPKQFLQIAGSGTMLQETAARLSPLVAREDIYVICGRQYVNLVRSQMPQLGEDQVIVEPMPRNTAPCIGLAALALRRRFGNEVLAILPADHSIGQTEEFHQVLSAAAELAAQGWLVTFGIEPTFPATGYGYIQRAEVIGEIGGKRAYRVERFAEKPDVDLARQFLESGDYYWNSGMFVWTIENILEQFRTLMPDLHEILLAIDRFWGDDDQLETLFGQAPSISIDYGVMERAQGVATVPCGLAWSDVGNWRAVEDLLCRDSNGIAANTRYVQVASRNSLLHSASGKLLALVGVENLIVVETPDVVLVCDRNRAEDVKQIVEQLRENGPRDFL